MKSIEELATLVWNQGNPPVRGTPEKVIDFATRFLAAYTEQQEPVAWRFNAYPHIVQRAHISEGLAKVYSESPNWTSLYSAPVVPADMVLVPREPTDAMIGNEWNRDMLAGIWRAMIAAGEKS